MNNTQQMTEEEALLAIWWWALEYGWSYLVFSRLHVEEYIGRKLTEDEWRRLRLSEEWLSLAERTFSNVDQMHKVVDNLLGDE